MELNNKIEEFEKELKKYKSNKNPEILYKINKLLNENKILLNHYQVGTTENYKFLRIASILAQFII